MVYIVLKDEAALSDVDAITAELEAICKQKLYDYYFPIVWRFIPELPYTRNGKIDYRALEQIMFFLNLDAAPLLRV